MGTKSHWRKGRLRFYGSPMFTSIGAQSTNVRITGADVKTPTVTVQCPLYTESLTTDGAMHFHARIAGVTASSSACIMTATLRYETATILSLAFPAQKFKARNIPYNVDFHGRFAEASTLGNIAAIAIGTIGSHATTSFTVVAGTVGSTDGSRTKWSTSEINLQVNSSRGLNVVVSIATTQLAGGADIPTAITNTLGYIELFSG